LILTGLAKGQADGEGNLAGRCGKFVHRDVLGVPARGARGNQTAGFDVRLLVRLARRPVWLLGIASMILGFVFQLAALRFGDAALVQPILAGELLFVFGYLATVGSRRVKRRDWLAAAAMSAGIGVFLRLASRSAGRPHAPGSSWLLALVVVIVGASVLSRSSLIAGENGHLSCEHKPALGSAANSPSAIRPLAPPKDPLETGSSGARRRRALSPDVALRARSAL